jgi:hypothetical protein
MNPMVGAVLQSLDKVYDATQQVERCKDENMVFGSRVVPCPATAGAQDRRGRRKRGHLPLYKRGRSLRAQCARDAGARGLFADPTVAIAAAHGK